MTVPYHAAQSCNCRSLSSSRSRTMPREPHHALALKIAQHPGNHLPVGAQVIGNGLMGDLQQAAPSMEASSSRKAATRLSRLFHMTCSISHMTSENRLAISSLV